MTLDIFQKTMESIASKFKADIMELLSKGVEAKLDEDLMLVILNREMEKLQND